MYRYFIGVGIILIIFSFVFYLLGLMRIVPLIFTIIPMFLSILFTVHSWNNRNRFRGAKHKVVKQ
ncbi:hypothetical protein [Calidifontibacillus oryziterrae]|uniref:hypothetical protein n=1 Tax=Calidifontibacillus oryziterrae TaxID=1191699 RepID=UPI000318DC66|nr:hypothetical protein [Calidifontibacillus oryziterrae]